MTTHRTLVWFRRDLRVRDNTALYDAAARGEAVALWVVSPGEWRAHDDAPVKVDFWLRNVHALAAELAAREVPLRVAYAAEMRDVPGVVLREAKATRCDAVVWNREHEVDERRRDERVAALCAAEGIRVQGFDDRVAVPPDDVRTDGGTPYTVFTPFLRRWFAALKRRGWRELPAPPAQRRLDVPSMAPPACVDGFTSPVAPSRWLAGEAVALARLDDFARTRLARYARDRDAPALEGTSALSPYLAAGVLSPRQCLAAAAKRNEGFVDVGDDGAVTWVTELAWRDFYQHVLHHFPRVSMGRAFKRETERVPWRDAPEELARWCEGRTGHPLVDAAMRQLAATGWMHNRLRMVTAMYLSKHLLVDWRAGERFFMRHLVDGDLGANNGGWQWSASTGTDAQPYFRVFNPSRQSKTHDPDGDFIVRYVPELRGVARSLLHTPEKIPDAVLRAVGYPRPVVSHELGRARAIAAFRGLGA